MASRGFPATARLLLVLPLAYSCNIYVVIWPTGYGTMDKLIYRLNSRLIDD